MSELLPGKISISRTHASNEEDYMTITVIDESSHVQFADIKIGIKTFMDCLTGLAHQPCSFDLRRPELVGMVKESKSELVQKPEWNATDEDIDEILIPYEANGWRAVRENIKNHHNYRGDKVQVSFFRYVAPE